MIPCELLFRESSDVSKAVCIISVGYHQNLMVKTILLKSPHALVTGQRNQDAIVLEASSMTATLHSPGRCYKASGGELEEVPAYDATNWPARCAL